MFGWFKSRRRKRILAEPLPDHWREVLSQQIWQYELISEDQREKLDDCVKIFVAEKNWEGCDGLEMNELVKLTIAGQASLLLLGSNDYYFDGIRTVLVYPRPFRRKMNNGLIVAENQHNAGEAWQGGPIVLSWNDVLEGNRFHNDGHNVVVHEFAHHLDGIDGEMGGSPPFDSADDRRWWNEVMPAEFEELCLAVAEGRWTVLDHYGATNEAEFFAVASEAFFRNPWQAAGNSWRFVRAAAPLLQS